MPFTPRILAFSGSMRKESFNTRLARLGAAGASRAGADVTFIELRDFSIPLYNGDDEAARGLPAEAQRLKQLFIDHHGLLIASPEHNSSFSAALKNAIDWVSRKSAPDEEGLIAFKGKVAGLMAASPGALGGLRGLVHLRAMLGNINVLVLAEQRAITKANEAFAPDGQLADAKQQKGVEAIGATLAETIRKLRGGDE